MIHAQGEDSEEGQLIYLTRKGSFQVNLYKMIRFLSEIQETGRNSNKEASRLYAELLLCVCLYSEHI